MPPTDPPNGPDASPRPLVVTDDPTLLDDLLRLSAAAAVEVTVAHTSTHAGRDWSRAPLVVVGTDLLASVADHDPPPHLNVVVAGRGDARTGSGAAPHDDALRIGARGVLSLPDDEPALADLFADSAHARKGRALVVAIVSGRGGAGASLLAVALALAGERARLCTTLVDADPLGGGLDLLIGQEHAPGARWDGLAAREGRMNWPALRGALPAIRGLALLTWRHDATEPVPPPAMRAVLASATRGADLIVADIPRTPDEATEEVLRRTTVGLVVVPADVHAVVAAQRLLPRLRERVADLRVVVRGGHRGLSARSVADTLGLPLAGEVPTEPDLALVLDRGDTPAATRGSPLARFADNLLGRLRTEHGRTELAG